VVHGYSPLFGANWNAGSRASNWNNQPDNSNSNIGARGVCDDSLNLRWVGQGCPGRPLVVSRAPTSFGKYISRSAKQGVVKYRDLRAAFFNHRQDAD
jgi:hypothetical protein